MAMAAMRRGVGQKDNDVEEAHKFNEAHSLQTVSLQQIALLNCHAHDLGLSVHSLPQEHPLSIAAEHPEDPTISMSQRHLEYDVINCHLLLLIVPRVCCFIQHNSSLTLSLTARARSWGIR